MSSRKRPDVSADVESKAEGVRLQPIDSAAMTVRPGAVTSTYAELEYDTLADEQEPLWRAEGLLASRDATNARDAAKPGAGEARHQLDAQRAVGDDARAVYQQASKVLGPFRRREPGAKKWYLTRWALLLGGDVAGQAGAALAYGEPYVTALPQALATGMAALTAGMVGAELRDLRLAARRQCEADDLPSELVPWAHLFRSPDLGKPIAKIIVGVAAMATLAIAGAIFWLRSVIDGSASGGVYGLLAVGIALASAINSYFYADEIADQIDAAEKTYARELKRAEMMAVQPQLVRHASARAESKSIRGEYAARGHAAATRLTALKWRVLRNNPGIAGHGVGSNPETPIGRRIRGGGRP